MTLLIAGDRNPRRWEDGTRLVSRPAGTELPPDGCARWTPYCKLAVIDALNRGGISLADAHQRWSLSDAEIEQWLDGFARNGLIALYITKR